MLAPGRPERREIREPIGGQQRGRRLALPPHVPRPLGRVDVCERLPDRFEAAAQVAIVLLGRQTLDRFDRTVPRPVVIIEHRLQVLNNHAAILSQRVLPTQKTIFFVPSCLRGKERINNEGR